MAASSPEDVIMSKNEKSSPKVATLAARVLSGDKKPTPKEILTLAASVLTQTPDKKPKK